MKVQGKASELDCAKIASEVVQYAENLEVALLAAAWALGQRGFDGDEDPLLELGDTVRKAFARQHGPTTRRYFARLTRIDDQKSEAIFTVAGEYNPDFPFPWVASNLGGPNDGRVLTMSD